MLNLENSIPNWWESHMGSERKKIEIKIKLSSKHRFRSGNWCVPHSEHPLHQNDVTLNIIECTDASDLKRRKKSPNNKCSDCVTTHLNMHLWIIIINSNYDLCRREFRTKYYVMNNNNTNALIEIDTYTLSRWWLHALK